MSGYIPSLKKITEHVASIELRRPESANRLEIEDLAKVEEYVRICENDPKVRVIIFSSQGKYFSAGLDFKELKNIAIRKTNNERAESDLERTANIVANTKLITIASIQGPIFGGATDLVLACDLRIGSFESSAQMPAAKIGLPLYPSAIERYVSNLGLTHAKRLILTGVSVSAEELLKIGFLSELVSASNLQDRAFQLAKMVSEFPFEPVSAMKKYINSIETLEIGDRDQSRQDLFDSFDGAKIFERINNNRKPK